MTHLVMGNKHVSTEQSWKASWMLLDFLCHGPVEKKILEKDQLVTIMKVANQDES